MLAAVAGLLVGLAPASHVLVDERGALHFAFRALETVGEAGPAVALLGVGAEFISQGWPSPGILGYPSLAGVVPRAA